MIATATFTPPQPKALIEDLKREFSDRYSYRSFGSGSERKIVVSWSMLALAQITIHENGLSVEKPSAISVFVSNVSRYLVGAVMPLGPYREKLQNHLTNFLRRKYKN